MARAPSLLESIAEAIHTSGCWISWMSEGGRLCEPKAYAYEMHGSTYRVYVVASSLYMVELDEVWS